MQYTLNGEMKSNDDDDFLLCTYKNGNIDADGGEELKS